VYHLEPLASIIKVYVVVRVQNLIPLHCSE